MVATVRCYVKDTFPGRGQNSMLVYIMNIHALFACSSGQQILRGDRVIVKGEKPGEY